MMTLRTWNKKWFGFWLEDGPELGDCPSAAQWVDPAWRTEVDINGVVRYLDGAECVWAESPPDRCSLCSLAPGSGKGYRTDGVWYWSGQLAHQIEVHDIRLPPALADRIAAAGYSVPTGLWRDEHDFVETLRQLDVPAAHRATIQHFIMLREGRRRESQPRRRRGPGKFG